MKWLVAILIALTLAAPTSAQDKQQEKEKEKSFWQQLKIRQTFSGTVEEDESPARVSYNDSTDTNPYFLVDLGIKSPERDLCPNAPRDRQCLYGTTVEWHRSTDDGTNKLTIGEDLSITIPTSSVSPIFDATVNFGRDFHADETTASAHAFLTAFSETTVPAGPGRPIFGNRLEYFPYAGLEYYQNVAIKDDDDNVLADAFHGAFAALKLSVHILPLSTTDGPSRRLELIAQYVHRNKISGSDHVADQLGAFSASAIYWLDTDRSVGVAYTYDTGETPDDNFRNVSRSAVTLTFKR